MVDLKISGKCVLKCNEHTVARIRLKWTGKGSFTRATKKSGFTLWLGQKFELQLEMLAAIKAYYC